MIKKLHYFKLKIIDKKQNMSNLPRPKEQCRRQKRNIFISTSNIFLHGLEYGTKTQYFECMLNKQKTADAPIFIFYLLLYNNIFYFVSCAFVTSRKLQTLRVYLLFLYYTMIYSIFVSCTIICQCMLTSRQTADAPTIIFYFVLHNDILSLYPVHANSLYFIF